MKKELRYPEAQCDMSVSISSDSDLRISVEKLRDILMDMADGDGLGYMFETPDEIINRVKKEI